MVYHYLCCTIINAIYIYLFFRVKNDHLRILFEPSEELAKRNAIILNKSHGFMVIQIKKYLTFLIDICSETFIPFLDI